MHQSIPSLTDPHPGRPLVIRNILVAPGVGFSLLCLARGSALGGGLKSKQKFDNFEKSVIFALSLKQMSSSSFHMFIFVQVNSNRSWSKFHLIQDLNMANMPKKTKLYPRFLLLRIYPNSPVHRSIQIWGVFRFAQLRCKFSPVNAFTLWYKRVAVYLGNYLSTFFCVLSFIRIDPNLRIASKQIKL